MSTMHHAALDDEIVVALLDLLKEMPFRQGNPMVATPGEVQRALMVGGFLRRKHHAAHNLNVRMLTASLLRVAHELRRRGVHVEQGQRIPGLKPLPGSPPENAFCIWCDPDALLDVVWRGTAAPTVTAATPDPSPIIEPMGIDPPRARHLRAASVAD